MKCEGEREVAVWCVCEREEGNGPYPHTAAAARTRLCKAAATAHHSQLLIFALVCGQVAGLSSSQLACLQ